MTAIQSAPDDVAGFLQICRNREISRANDLIEPLMAARPGEGALTIRLAYLSQFVGLCESFQLFDESQWHEILATAIGACQESIEISDRLADQRCVAIYSSLLSRGFQNSGAYEQAEVAQNRALEVYRLLAQEEPDLHRPRLARMLNNLGSVLMDLGRFVDAKRAYGEAFLIFRQLDETGGSIYRADVEMTLNGLGNVHSQLRDLPTACDALRRALTIYRHLSESDPSTYSPDLAMTLTNLGNTLFDLRELSAARDAQIEALAIYRRLNSSQFSRYRCDVGMALNNLGNTLNDLYELAGARQAQQEALVIYRQLAESQPDVYQPDVAMALNNLGNSLNDLSDWTAARDTFRESLAAYRRLAESQPDVYLPHVAGALCNLGTALHESGDLTGACEVLNEALAIRRQLTDAQPGIYQPQFATALNNLATVLSELGEREEAHRVLCDAREMHRSAETWIEAAMPSANLGRIEKENGNAAAACHHFENALADLHKGLKQLENPDHNDVFKASLEDVAVGLIEIYSSGFPGIDSMRLAGLFESLRRHHLLGEGEGEGAHLLSAIEQGTGPVAESLRRRQAAFVWLQAVQHSVVFAVVRPGCAMTIAATSRRWLQLFEAALKEMREFIRSVEIKDLIANPARYPGSTPDMAIRCLMGQAFAALPSGVRELLAGNETKTIFVSPCRITVDFPLELLLSQSEFIGLRKVLVRVHGLEELADVMERLPEITKGRRMLVGDPDNRNAGIPALTFARRAVRRVAILFERAGLPAEARYRKQATRKWLLSALGDQYLGVFIFSGHGGTGSLLLAQGEQLAVSDIVRIRWMNAPYFHFDCCLAGANWGLGGGRFSGLPAVCLENGASAVLASFHYLPQGPASDFSLELYSALCSGTALGEALLQACQKTNAQYGGNPVFWAASVLWGNPFVSFVPAVHRV